MIRSRHSSTDQHSPRTHHARVRHRQRPDDLLHEQSFWIWRRVEDLHTAGGQVNDEDRGVRHEAPPRPDFRCEEFRTRDDASMRFQKRLPRARALRDRGQARRFQDPPNGRAAHAVADVLQGALYPRVTPRWILRRHPHDKPSNLHHDAARPRLAGVHPFLRNQLPMPAPMCPASRSCRSRARPYSPRGTPAQPAVGDRRR